ncbi:MAG: SRPBCC family protein [Chloroflexota bacterium]
MNSGFTATATIKLPVQQVWRFLVDMEQSPAWMKGVNKITPVGPNHGLPNGTTMIGARFTTHLSTSGQGAQREVMVTAWEPNHRFALTSNEGGILTTYEYCLRSKREYTEMTLHAEFRASGVWRLIGPLVTYMMKRHDGNQLELFKEAAEKFYASNEINQFQKLLT